MVIVPVGQIVQDEEVAPRTVWEIINAQVRNRRHPLPSHFRVEEGPELHHQAIAE
ncbi:unnamed protein product [Meloidogyne enterolobii]|uniref:Uncharacterized protein n=1 Tax=Meloidogyne enterolobii TaxID=390850 RepID=A0ACB0YPP7_MELEN